MFVKGQAVGVFCREGISCIFFKSIWSVRLLGIWVGIIVIRIVVIIVVIIVVGGGGIVFIVSEVFSCLFVWIFRFLYFGCNFDVAGLDFLVCGF